MENQIELLTDFISRNWYYLIIIGYLLWLLIRQRRSATVFESKDEFDAVITSGLPVIVEFYNDT